MFFGHLCLLGWLTFICFLGSRGRNVTSRCPMWLSNGEEREQVVEATEATENCALEYCRYYPDISSNKSITGGRRCIPEDVKEYRMHWLRYGQYDNRYRCGNYTKICGAIWRGKFANSNRSCPSRIDIVIAYCTEDLGWLPKFIASVSTRSIVKKVTIISKCSVDVNKTMLAQSLQTNVTNIENRGRNDVNKTMLAQSLQTNVTNIENRGRNDHTYVYYILKQVLDDEELDDDAVILFVKGGMPALVHRESGRTLKSKVLPTDYVIEMASSTGFACFVEHFPASMYHRGTELKKFKKSTYKDHVENLVERPEFLFKSNFSNLGEWLAWSQSEAHAILPQHMKIMPVCYEGNFAARVGNIRRQRRSWEHFQALLQRGDNIEEGHFMERTWAIILKDDPGDILEEIPHHAEYISRRYDATPGRFVRCLPEYQTGPPTPIEKMRKKFKAEELKKWLQGTLRMARNFSNSLDVPSLHEYLQKRWALAKFRIPLDLRNGTKQAIENETNISLEEP